MISKLIDVQGDECLEVSMIHDSQSDHCFRGSRGGNGKGRIRHKKVGG